MRVDSKSKPVVHNVHILDASGSMRGDKWRAACDLINAEIKAFKDQTDVELLYSLVVFSNRVTIALWRTQNPQPIVPSEHWMGSTTSLDQAVVETLEMLLAQTTNEKVLVKIFTDGEENSSNERSKKVVKDVIKKANGFTIAFAGTPDDVEKIKFRYGLEDGNLITHDNTAEGIKDLSKSYVQSTATYFKDVVEGKDVTQNFFHKKLS